MIPLIKKHSCLIFRAIYIPGFGLARFFATETSTGKSNRFEIEWVVLMQHKHPTDLKVQALKLKTKVKTSLTKYNTPIIQ